jgi:hypothetical protein
MDVCQHNAPQGQIANKWSDLLRIVVRDFDNQEFRILQQRVQFIKRREVSREHHLGFVNRDSVRIALQREMEWLGFKLSVCWIR